MTHVDWIELAIFSLLLLGLSPLIGKYLATIFNAPPKYLAATFGALETGIYKISGIDPAKEMAGKEYLKALLLFNGIGIIFLFLLQIFQQMLPLNPQHFPAVPWPVAINTAISFVTNTNWQSYEGENSLSYLTQALGMGVQNFFSAATGLCILLVLMRGICSIRSDLLGNFWRDLTRSIVYVFLPLSTLVALLLISQGVIQNINPYQTAVTFEEAHQTIPGGLVASQVAIKQLGTNGGGYFGANSAHPFENPTPLSNFIELLAILLIPASLPFMYGNMTGQKKQGTVFFIFMFIFWLAITLLALLTEWAPNPSLGLNPVYEGKEMRIGISNSVLWTIATTATSNGSTNAMLDSLAPLTGGLALFQMILGEVIFGGIGSGLCSLLMFVLLTVFIAGQMVGRSAEFAKKKIEKTEILWAVAAIIAPAALTLIGASYAFLMPTAISQLTNGGPHSLTEMLYGFASTSAGNGSSFEGLNASTLFFNLIFGLIMIIARLSIIIPTIAIATSLAKKGLSTSNLGTVKTDTWLFSVLLACILLVVSALTFFPAFSLGPIAEHLLMLKGHVFS